MITVLVDHNIEGQAALLKSTLVSEGWIRLAVMRIVSFKELSLPLDTSDRKVWEFAQKHRMVLLTANRNKDDEASLEQAILEPQPALVIPSHNHRQRRSNRRRGLSNSVRN